MDTQTANSAHQAKGFLRELETFFDTYLHKKVPFHLPANAKQWLVKFVPWITLLIMLWALNGLWADYRFIDYVNTVPAYAYNYYGYHLGITYYLAVGLSLVAFILQGASLPGLFAKTLRGWELLYYSVLAAFIAELISGNLVDAIIVLIVSIYLLFQIREYYK